MTQASFPRFQGLAFEALQVIELSPLCVLSRQLSTFIHVQRSSPRLSGVVGVRAGDVRFNVRPRAEGGVSAQRVVVMGIMGGG